MLFCCAVACRDIGGLKTPGLIFASWSLLAALLELPSSVAESRDPAAADGFVQVKGLLGCLLKQLQLGSGYGIELPL